MTASQRTLTHLKTYRKRAFLCLTVLLLIALVIWISWGNTALAVTNYQIESARLPVSFDGFTIVQISDLHNASFGKNNEKLLKLIEAQAPDLIVLTGDLIDASHTELQIAESFIEAALDIAPIYLITGNHEAALDNWNAVKDRWSGAGAIILEDTSVTLTRSDGSLVLTGLQDPAFLTGEQSADLSQSIQSTLNSLAPQETAFHLLLAHRPELFDVYAVCPVDLILSGHAHGGQFRLPFIGGLYAPGQGLFPQYASGLFTQNETAMIVSRGLGNSVIPFRLNNRPEVVVVTLQSAHSA